MRRPSFSRLLVAAMLVAGVALAQQGLIVEPWHKAPAPVAAPLPPLRAMPGSGLAPVRPAILVPRQAKAPPAPLAEPQKWSPPVVQLLVDPWARTSVAAPPARPARLDWVPTRVDAPDIVDPWAEAARQPAPRVASHTPGPPQSTIF